MLKLKLVTMRSVALNLLKHFEKEKEKKSLYYSVNKPKKRVVAALGLSKATLNRWLKNESGLSKPKHDVLSKSEKIKKVDSFNKDLVQRVVTTMFSEKQLVTTFDFQP